MSLEELGRQFLVNDEVRSERLEQLLKKALPHCVVDTKGTVHLKNFNLSGKEQVKLVLAARLIASKLPEATLGGAIVGNEVTIEQIAEYTGLPKNQASARAKECLDEKFAERSARGSYRARAHKLEQFLDGLTTAGPSRTAS